MVIGIIIIALALLYGVAEFFGRSKHIGKWWAFSLLATSLIGGIIAIAVSPSAKNDPTKPKPSFKTWGWVCIVFGALNILVLNPLAIGFFLLGVYLFELSKGNIVNSDPKYYFDQISKPVAKSSYNSVKSAPNKPIFNRKSNPAPLDSTQKYFIIENDKQSQPFSIEELKSKEIKEDTFVWRKGLEDWVKAKDLPEIEDIIFYQPPPFVPKEDIEEKQEETPPEIPVKTEPTYHIENFDYTLGDIEKAIKNHKYFDRNTIVKLPDGRESKFQEIPEFWNFIDDYYPPEIGKKKTLAENEHSIKAKENKKEKRNGLIIVIVSIIVIFSILIGASLFHNSYRPTQKTNSSKTETTKKKDFSN